MYYSLSIRSSKDKLIETKHGISEVILTSDLQLYNKTKQQTHTQHLKVQSKGRERGKDNKNTKVTPLYNHVYLTKNTAKHQWSKAWPHRLTLLYIHTSLFAGG